MTDARTPLIWRFVGHSGAGKTTLLERVITVLVGRGIRVAAAKDTHHDLRLDEPGKDSWRISEAGASQVILTGPGRLVLFERVASRPTLGELALLVGDRAALLLAEGYRDDSAPAVLVYRGAQGRPLPELTGPIHAVVSDRPIDVPAPHFAFAEVEALVDHLLGINIRLS